MRLAICAALVLTACATTAKFEAKMNSWLGHSEADLVGGLGPPQNFYSAPDGSRFLTFARSSNMQLGGGTQYQPVRSTTTGNIYGSNGGSANYNSTTTSYQAVQASVYNVALSCQITFRVYNDRVQSWRWEGNNCKSQ